jgi:hypothetical protein
MGDRERGWVFGEMGCSQRYSDGAGGPAVVGPVDMQIRGCCKSNTQPLTSLSIDVFGGSMTAGRENFLEFPFCPPNKDYYDGCMPLLAWPKRMEEYLRSAFRSVQVNVTNRVVQCRVARSTASTTVCAD